MKEIPLTQGQFALVDDEDYEWLAQWKWNANKQGNTFYAQRNPGVKAVKAGENKILKMHRVILNAPKGSNIDHVDGNGLNNQKSNLRIVTKRQNAQNQRNATKTSKYPGVHWYSREQRWRASICRGEQRIQLGKFNNEINAFKAYYDAVLALGEELLDFPYPDIPENELETYCPSEKNQPRAVVGINITNPKEVLYFQSMSDAQRIGGFCIQGISKCCYGKRHTHHGYRWKWAT